MSRLKNMSQKTKETVRVLALIPARGGSKGIPRKNIHIMAGKPLIAWTIETALACPRLDNVIVTTDDEEIAKIAKDYGAEVPFLRPAELAQDNTPDLPVYQHAVSWLAEHEGYHPDIICWLRPTSPLRTVEDMENAINLLIQTKADSVRSVCVSDDHPYFIQKMDGTRLQPLMDNIDRSKYYNRQMLPTVYRFNGAVDVTWCKTVMEKGQLYSGDLRGSIMPPERSIDIDNELDLILAETLLEKGLKDEYSAQ
jgi:CMP-N-acetylneuraminic acid synthetase